MKFKAPTQEQVEDILDYLASVPDHGARSVTTDLLKMILLHTHGQMHAFGVIYEIKNKALGAGIYRVWLEERKTDLRGKKV